jgi:hypothetical protein
VIDSKTYSRKKVKADSSREYIDYICGLYGDSYDDREEDSKPQGKDWVPGESANHKSLEGFRKQLKSNYDIELSTAKIRKILITGGRWSTERSREIQKKYAELKSIPLVAERLGLSTALVVMNLPYEKVVYDLEDKSGNARRIERWRNKSTGKSCYKRLP